MLQTQDMLKRQETRQEQTARYRSLAEEAEKLAKTTLFADNRESYLRYARCWRVLANEIALGHSAVGVTR